MPARKYTEYRETQWQARTNYQMQEQFSPNTQYNRKGHSRIPHINHISRLVDKFERGSANV